VSVITVPAGDLSAGHVRDWERWHREDPSLCSPFFHPEFTRHVAAVRSNVEVAILEEQGETIGFFPFQRGDGGVGGPIGESLCDFQGVIARPGAVFAAEPLIRGCGLNAWHFHHLLASQRPFRKHHYGEAPSLYMDLEGGFQAYCNERAKAGSQQIRKAMQKARKIGREVGEIRFEPHTTCPEVFETLIRWKVAQYYRIEAINYLAPDWTRELLRRVAALDDPAFCGMLSAMYFGDRLAAVHLGLRSGPTLHAWFPAYNPELADYSPGLILFVKLAEAAESQGIRRIDLGRGTERFKVSLGSGAVSVAEGSVDLRFVARSLRHGAHSFFGWLRTSPLRTPARAASRLAPRLRKWASFH
jgi:CelD/BcsL family acetyltransferase involved in cellulose biosynthesis